MLSIPHNVIPWLRPSRPMRPRMAPLWPLVAGVVLLVAPPCLANLIANGDFEEDAIPGMDITEALTTPKSPRAGRLKCVQLCGAGHADHQVLALGLRAVDLHRASRLGAPDDQSSLHGLALQLELAGLRAGGNQEHGGADEQPWYEVFHG